MQQNPFWNLMAKKLSREISPEELGELEALLKQTPELGYAAEHIENLWKLHPTYSAQETERAFEKHVAALNAQGIHLLPDEELILNDTAPANNAAKTNRKFIFSTLVIALIATGGYIFWKPQNTGLQSVPSQTAEVYTSPGTRKKIVLPDSSVVWLNAGSKLTYDNPFTGKERQVSLTGEAFFDVVKSGKPFIIHTSGVQIRVLGTAFNVRNYPSEKKIETSLVRGRVEVTIDDRPEKKYVLQPNEKLTLNTQTDTNSFVQKKKQLPIAVVSTLQHIDSSTIVETSWVQNKLVFVDESFEDVAKKMEQWYNVTIDIQDEALAQMHVGGGPFENETVQQALVALQIAFNFHFTVNGQHIKIFR